jgi:hypothetical protein
MKQNQSLKEQAAIPLRALNTAVIRLESMAVQWKKMQECEHGADIAAIEDIFQEATRDCIKVVFNAVESLSQLGFDIADDHHHEAFEVMKRGTLREVWHG